MFGQAISRMSLWGFILSVLVICSNGTIQAQAPNVISYQGRLTDDSGVPLNTSVDLTVVIYSDSLGSSKLWEENHMGVTVSEGLFDINLGSQTAFGPGVFDGSKRWLGISVDGGDLLQPLTPIVSSPYSIKSGHAGTASNATLADTASFAVEASHADTATIALYGISGWKDIGSVVVLKDFGDSVGIGTEHPDALFEVEASANAIVGHSLGGDSAIAVQGIHDYGGVGVYGISDDGIGIQGHAPNGWGGYFTGLRHYFNRGVGVGIEYPTDMVHVYNDNALGQAYIKIQSAHSTYWDECGIKIYNPQNLWLLRMGRYSEANFPQGSLSLLSIQGGSEVMTWTQSGYVGINRTSPTSRLDVEDELTAIHGHSTDGGVGVQGISPMGFGGYFDGAKNCFFGPTGFGTTAPTHTVTINGSIAFQLDGTTKYHMRHYNGGLNLAEAGVADYRLFIKDGGNIGIGTSNPTAKLHVAGTFHADAFEADAIDHTNIVDEVGIASATSGTFESPTSAWSSILSRQITVPAGGYILAIGYARVTLNHGLAGITRVNLAFSGLPDDIDGGYSSSAHLSNDANAGVRTYTLPVQRLFHVSSAGTYTYHMIATKGSSDYDSDIFLRQMDLLFIPTAYSSKNGVIEEIGDDVLYPRAGQPDEAPQISRNLKADTPESSIETLEVRLNSLLTEAESIRRELEILKEK